MIALNKISPRAHGFATLSPTQSGGDKFPYAPIETARAAKLPLPVNLIQPAE